MRHNLFLIDCDQANYASDIDIMTKIDHISCSGRSIATKPTMFMRGRNEAQSSSDPGYRHFAGF